MPFGIIVSFKDRKAVGGIATTTINAPSATSWGDVTLFAGEIAKLIDPLLTGRITRVGIFYELNLASLGLATTVSDTSDVEEGAWFQFATADGNYSSNRIPTFNESLINVGDVGVNLAAPDVAAFVAAMTTGIDVSGLGGTGNVAPCDSRDSDLVALNAAKESFKSS